MHDSGDEAKGLALGAVDYVTKPYSPAVVLQRVRIHLELKESREKFQRLGRHYSAYLPAELTSSIQRGDTPDGRVAHRKPMTVLFCDIVNFTAQMEPIDPARMGALLNDYFETMAALVSARQGTLDKFIGDGLMVFFGDPTSRGPAGDAHACVQLALDMHAALGGLQAEWQATTGGQALRVRIGIASGECAVGNFGSKRQWTYTVLGHTVNLASRLEAAAPPGQVLVADATWQLVREHFTGLLQPPLPVKGVSKPVQTWLVSPLRRRS